MSEINASNFKKEHGDLAPDLVGVTELTSPYFFVPPSGDTASRPEDCEPGTLRFNTDIGSLEVFRGKTIGWEQIQRRESQYLGGDFVSSNGGDSSNFGTGTRLIVFGGNTNPANLNVIEYATVESKGNTADFGDLSETYPFGSDGACGSRVRGLTSGANNDGIDFVTISSLGNGTEFGDYHGNMQSSAFSNNIRGVFAGGYNPQPSIVDNISYVTIAQSGNSVDFGNLAAANRGMGGFSSSTRGMYAGGTTGAPSYSNFNNIQFVTIMTTGDTTDFGDINTAVDFCAGASNATRGIIAGGRVDPSGAFNTIEFITMATIGNAIDFGDLTRNGAEFSGSASKIEAVMVGGYDGSSTTNTMDFVTIATTGNAQDFGDLTSARYHASSTTNGHGGL